MSELLDLALQAHGGLERWREVQSLDVWVSLTGGLYGVKGYPEGLPNVNMRIDTRRPAVTIAPYARTDGHVFFTPDRVWIEDGAGRIVDDRDHPRASFAGQVLQTPWDQLHRLYFTSYAVWDYLTTPFLFAQPGFECKEIEPHQENGERWRRLQVKFPRDIPTHDRKLSGGSDYRRRHSPSTIRGFCGGSIMWPSARPRIIATTIEIRRVRLPDASPGSRPTTVRTTRVRSDRRPDSDRRRCSRLTKEGEIMMRAMRAESFTGMGAADLGNGEGYGRKNL